MNSEETNMKKSNFDMAQIIWDVQSNAKHEVVTAIITDLEKLNFPFADFLEGIGVYMDENLQLSRAAALVQQGHRALLDQNNELGNIL